MQILAGSRLGPYEIVGPLGAGGMGEVYRGKDTRLKREVAIKILPDQASIDPERQRRFQREAQAASALNHPNILVVHDVGSENGTSYIVSELVDGEALRKVIQKGPSPLKSLLDIAVQIADGLAAAHQAGITHRDLKPENIMVSNSRVKILDFGLAKFQQVGKEDAETVSRGFTQTGIILGTVAYMSPEQAGGKGIDFRSDQFSFGLILYEMATGKRAFSRNSSAETLSAIINEEPAAISSLNPKIPAPLRWLIDRCLSKDPRQRYDSTLDLYHELRNLRDHLSETTSTGATVPFVEGRPTRKRLVAAAILLLSILSTFFLTRLLFAPGSPDFSSYRFIPLATEPGLKEMPVWSPDGKTIAYDAEIHGVQQIFTRSILSPIAAQLTQSASDCWMPFWSPDGTRVFYTLLADRMELWSVSAAGGSPERVIDDSIRTATISPDGKTLVYMREGTGNSNSLWISSPPGAKSREYKETPFDKKVYWSGVLHFSSDGSKIGLWIPTSGNESANEFWIIPYPTGKPRRVLQAISNITPNLTFSWMRDSRHIIFGENFHGAASTNLWMADTQDSSIRPLTMGESNEVDPSVSPDGEKIAYVVHEQNSDLVEVPLDGSPMRSLLSTSRNEFHPAWSPIGNQYAYVTNRNGSPEIWIRSHQEGWERPLVTQKDFESDRTANLNFPSFLPDGHRIAYTRVSGKGEWGTWMSAVAGGPPVRVKLGGARAAWSPDGEWIAWPRGSANGFWLSKQKVPGGQPIDLKQQVELVGPQWSPTGEWISCQTPQGLVLVSPDGQNHRILSESNPNIHGWSKDGSMIYGIRQVEGGHLKLVSLDIQTGKEKEISEVGIRTPSFELPWQAGFSLAPDGKSFATTVYHVKGDIWLLEGFNKQIGFFERLWKR